jgi:hypothetical protein
VAAVTLATQRAWEMIEQFLKVQPNNELLSETAGRLKKATEFLWSKGEEHIKALQNPGMAVIIPPIAFLAFQKIK